MSEKSENFKNIISFISSKLRCNDENLFRRVFKIWHQDLNQSSEDWQQLSLLINTPGKIRRESIYSTIYYDYVYEFLSRCSKVIKKFPEDTMARTLAFKMIQEHIYLMYHDYMKTHMNWKITSEITFEKIDKGKGKFLIKGQQNGKYNFTIIIPEDKMGWVIGKRGSNIQKLRNENSNVNVYLDNKTKQMRLASRNFESILNCAQQVNDTIDNDGILIKTIINKRKWFAGILFEISVKYREVSPVSGNPLWLTHLTGIGDLITHNGETYELKMNQHRAKEELSSGKYTGVGFLKDNHHTFCIDGEEKMLNTFLSESEQKKIVSDAIHILETTKDGFKNKYVAESILENCYSDNFFRF